MKKTAWAGWIMVAQGVLHLVVTLLVARGHIGAWLRGELWAVPGDDMSQPAGHFWLSLGSFGFPLLVLGALVVRLARAGQSVPAFVGWAIGAWGTIGAVVVEPTPFFTALVPGVLLVLADRPRVRSTVGAGR